jgi:hypothetical protein
MQAIRLKTTISADRELKLRLPDSIQPGQVEVLVLREEQATKENPSLLQILDEIENSAEPGQSLEALNQRIEAERASWE